MFDIDVEDTSEYDAYTIMMINSLITRAERLLKRNMTPARVEVYHALAQLYCDASILELLKRSANAATVIGFDTSSGFDVNIKEAPAPGDQPADNAEH